MEFPGGKIEELSGIIVAQSMYIQCDVDSSEYLLPDLLIGYQADGKVMPLIPGDL